MTRLDFWFDPKQPSQWLALAFGVALAFVCFQAFSTSSTFRLIGPKVLRVIESTPTSDRIFLGEPYESTILVDKVRDDCENGRIIRQMIEINTGALYVTESFDSLQLDKGIHTMKLQMKTTPLDEDKGFLVKPGLWKINTGVFYDCPDGEGGKMIPRSYVFNTQPFRVLEEGAGS